MEIQNARRGDLYRGEIESIVVEEGWLKVRFAWVARSEGFPTLPTKWVKSSVLEYKICLGVFRAADIGPSGGGIGGDSRIFLESYAIGEIVVLFPPNGSKLDRSGVEDI